MKTLLILLVIFLLAAIYLYWRLRPYIKMARQIFGAARDVRHVRVGNEPADLPRRGEPRTAEPLVRCVSCNTWLPASRAVRLGKAGSYYCSHECLERAAENRNSTRRSAS